MARQTKLQIAAEALRSATDDFRYAEGCLTASCNAPDRRQAFLDARERRDAALAAWEIENDRAYRRRVSQVA